MLSERLRDRFGQALVALGTDADRDVVELAADFTRLVVRALSLSDPTPAERQVLVAALRARTELDDAALEALLGLALLPEFRTVVSPDELRVYGSHFGATAASALADEDAEDLDLPAFAQRYGTVEGLLLLDTLFAVAGANGRIRPDEVDYLRKAARQLGVDEVLVAALFRRYDPRHATGDLHFSLTANRVVIGRSSNAHVVLPDPQVALRHAELVRIGPEGWRVVDLGSGRPTVVNGSAVASAPLTADAVLRIGPYSLRLGTDEQGGERLDIQGERSFSALSVRQLTRRIGQVSLLDDVSFTVFSGEVIAMIGPSGSGKTTLLNAINGTAPPDSGDVLLDGQPFWRLLEADPSLVGIVPQDDLVSPELRVHESLFYSGRLRFAPDVRDSEIRSEVDRVLNELGIPHIKDSRIGDALRRGISGGQRKRVNLGQELMTRSTRILFLDEPTSGLDPRAAQDIVRVARQLADRGRIVFLVTHDLTPEVMAQVDHLLVLAPGGRLAYFGPPDEACAWFGVATPDAIFNRFADHTPEDWGRRYREGADHRKYVSTREHVLRFDAIQSDGDGRAPPRKRSSLSQLRTLVARYAKVKLRDRTGMAVLLVQPPILAVVMWLVFPGPTAPMLFMLALSALWFGMSGAVRELISDRIIWRRERKVGVGVVPYLASKVLVMGTIVALQCVALTAMLYLAQGMGGDFGFSLLGLCKVMVLTGWAGMTMGLLVSASWSSSEAAVGTLPLVIIPQIMFSGIMVSLARMGDLARAITWVTVDRFAFDAIIKTGQKVMYFDRTGKTELQKYTGPGYDFGFLRYDKLPDGTSVENSLPLDVLCTHIGGHAVAYLLVAGVLVWARYRKG